MAGPAPTSLILKLPSSETVLEGGSVGCLQCIRAPGPPGSSTITFKHVGGSGGKVFLRWDQGFLYKAEGLDCVYLVRG